MPESALPGPVRPGVDCAIADRALAAIEREARRWPDRETGGILVGLRRSQGIVVTHATGPGPRAMHSPLAFAKDTPYLQRVLDYLFGCFRVNYLGVWHQHPPDMPYPSAGDLRSAWQDIADPQVPGDDLLIPICVQRSGTVEIVPFLAQREGCAKVEWQVVPFSGLLMGQWHESPLGKERLAGEITGLRTEGAEVEVKRSGDGSYSFHVSPSQARARKQHQTLVFGCAQDYPVSPPEVAVYDSAAAAFSPVSLPGLESWVLDSTMSSLYRHWVVRFDPQIDKARGPE